MRRIGDTRCETEAECYAYLPPVPCNQTSWRSLLRRVRGARDGQHPVSYMRNRQPP